MESFENRLVQLDQFLPTFLDGIFKKEADFDNLVDTINVLSGNKFLMTD